MLRFALLLSATFLTLSAIPALSYSSNDDRPLKVGLALSGGGAKGFAHIGVIKVLEEAGIPIDYVTGTSMGALVGGLYAIGYTTDELEEIAGSINWENLFSDNVRRRNIPMEEKEWDGLFMLTLPIVERSISLPSGLVAGHRVEMLLRRLTWSYAGEQDFLDFPIPFMCIATDLENGEKVVLNSGDLADAIRASISIPSALAPKEVDGRLLVDGGVVRNLPVEEAFEMGADIVIAVNVSAPLKEKEELTNIFVILDQTVSFGIKASVEKSASLADLALFSEEIVSFGVADFPFSDSLIYLGEAMAREKMEEIKTIYDTVRESRPVLSAVEAEPTRTDEYFISQIKVEGNRDASSNQIKGRLMIEENTLINVDKLEEAIEAVYGMQFFDKVSYQIIHDPDNSNEHFLIIRVIEKRQDQFRFGFNYNNFDDATLLFNTTFRNLFNLTSITRLTAKLGESWYVDGRYFNYLGIDSYFALSVRANVSRQVIDLFDEDGNRAARYNTNAFFGEALFLPVMTDKYLSGIGLRQEVFNVSRDVGDFNFPGGTSTITQIYYTFQQDNLDRLNFTTRGHALDINVGQSFAFLDNAQNFFRAELKWRGFFQLSDYWVLQAGSWLGAASRSQLPLHKQFYLGGFPDLVGYRPFEINSSSIKSLSLGLQFEIFEDNFINVRSNLADRSDIFDFGLEPDNLFYGFSAGYGIETLVGPLSVNIMSSPRNNFMLVYSFGARF